LSSETSLRGKHDEPSPVFPDFNKIITYCKFIMKGKFKQYGNSWVGYDYVKNMEFWDKRLRDECREFINSSPHTRKKELADIINVACMIYENLESSDYRMEGSS
jgi:hypothetical protein